MEGFAKTGMLFDIYGELLTDKKKRVMEMYHEDDMSLSEISDELGISRAGVYDSLRSAEKLLYSYEARLGLFEEYLEREKIVSELRNAGLSMSDSLGKADTEKISADYCKRLNEKLDEIMQLIDKLD